MNSPMLSDPTAIDYWLALTQNRVHNSLKAEQNICNRSIYLYVRCAHRLGKIGNDWAHTQKYSMIGGESGVVNLEQILYIQMNEEPMMGDSESNEMGKSESYEISVFWCHSSRVGRGKHSKISRIWYDGLAAKIQKKRRFPIRTCL